MTIGVIDCGTNTFNLLIADVNPDGWKVIFQSKLPVKLGAGGFEDGEIKQSRFYRGLDAMLCHKVNLQNFECKKIFAFGTSALREASNGQLFVDDVANKFDIRIDVIVGDREAELIFAGVVQTINLTESPVLVMDIGGGSTEFIIGNKNGILWKHSFLLGVSRLHDLIKPTDRMSREDVIYLRTILDKELELLRLALQQFPVKWLIGSSGSFDTILELYHGTLKGHEIKTELSNDISLQSFQVIYEWLLKSTYEQRLKHPAIPAIRAEYMPLAAYLVNYALELFPFEKLIHSAYSLKEGALQSFVQTIDWSKEVAETTPNIVKDNE